MGVPPQTGRLPGAESHPFTSALLRDHTIGPIAKGTPPPPNIHTPHGFTLTGQGDMLWSGRGKEPLASPPSWARAGNNVYVHREGEEAPF